MKEKGNMQSHIYYVGKALFLAKTCCTNIEKFVLSLVNASKMLRP